MKQEKNLTIVTIKIKTIIILTVTIITLIAFATVLKLTNLTKINLIGTSKYINVSKEVSSTINMVSNQEDKDANTVTVANENNLSILRLNRAGMLPDFNPDIKEYYIIVGEEINNLEVTAVPENEDDKVIIEGNNNLKNGLNTITVRVTSKNDINSKNKNAKNETDNKNIYENIRNEEEYKIYVTKTSNKEEANANLENLAVEGYTLSPNFQNQVLNYTLEVDNENIDKLNILAIPENYDAKIEIKGNENINLNSQKENIVNVIVTAPNGITFQKYQIAINKKQQENISNDKTDILNSSNIIWSENNINSEMNNILSSSNINIQNSLNENEENNKIEAERLSNYKEIELSQKQKLEILIKQNSITILGILASIAVLGIVVILLYRKKKQK